MRVCQGGHDVPEDRLRARFERTLANLQRAIQRLPHVIVLSNEDLSNPYQLIAMYENGQEQPGLLTSSEVVFGTIKGDR